MRSPPGVSTVKLLLASASPPGALTSLIVTVAQRWRKVTSISLPAATLMSAATIELVGVGALAPPAALPTPTEPTPTVSRKVETI